MVKIQNLRRSLKEYKATWSVHEKFLDTNIIPKYGLGGSKKNLELSAEAPRIDFKKTIRTLSNNPYLFERRISLGIIPRTAKKNLVPGSKPIKGTEPSEVPPAGGGGTPATSVDWRKRWDWPWITRIRDQNPCSACWAFAAIALVEAMVRIEHAVWCERSEGDVHKGMGATCSSTGGSANALDWIKNNGIADPDCFAWTTANVAYTPTADRPGRIVKIPGYTWIGSTTDQKTWLDTIGPIVTFFEVWSDFFAYGTGIYHKQPIIDPVTGQDTNIAEGGHYMLIVGYDDVGGYWIVKNSWGSNWGENGYCRIGYGECDIDTFLKIGLQQYTDPDPWTKRRLHNGNMIESGNSTLHRNFEMVATASGNKIRHWWRDNSVSGFPWHQGQLFLNDCAACPTLIESTYNRNLELIYPTVNNRLHHLFREQSSGQWKDSGVFGPMDVAGIPGFIQSNYNAPGNFEVVVRTSDSKLAHWYRVGGSSWHEGVRFGNNIALSGPSLIQSHYFNKGNFELVCVTKTGKMQHWWRNNDQNMTWNPGAIFGNNIGTPPCMIEGQYYAEDETEVGNFELCVAAGGQVQHWWRHNKGDQQWRNPAVFGHDVASVVALLQGSYGFNLEVIVLRTDNKLQHYYRTGQHTWHEGQIIGNA